LNFGILAWKGLDSPKQKETKRDVLFLSYGKHFKNFFVVVVASDSEMPLTISPAWILILAMVLS
jgi:hypothetical protein